MLPLNLTATRIIWLRQKDKPELCEQLSKAMEESYAANPNFAEELYNKYFPDKYINSITFTDEEDKFIKGMRNFKSCCYKRPLSSVL